VKSMEMAVESMESMEMDPGELPHPGRVPEQRLLSPKIGLRQRWRCGTFLGKTPIDLGFSRWRDLIGRRAMSEVDQGAHTTPRRSQGGARHPRVWLVDTPS
jgi:hypothetical protein